MKSSYLESLSAWFAEQCDGDWEHTEGIRIETIDNPGWWLEVSLHGTELEGKKLKEVVISRSEQDWLRCHVDKTKFHGFGGPQNLRELVEIFLNWVAEQR